MSLVRWAKKRDTNDADLLLAARALGARLWKLDTPCDYLLLWCGKWHAVEIKTPKGRPTSAQLEFYRAVHAGGGRVIVWRTYSDVVDSLNAIRSETCT